MPQDSNEIRVLLVEDTPVTREALALLINGSSGFRCLAACACAEDALAIIPRARPDIVLMDIQLPGMSGIDCIRRIRERHPQIKIVMLTVLEDHDQIFKSLAAGAIGYIVKKTPPAKLLEAIQDAHQGGSPMSSQIAREVVRYFHDRPSVAPVETNLSPREQQILDLLARGHLYKEIGDELQIGIGSVRTYVRRIYEKLHVRNRAEAVLKAFTGR